MLIVEQHDPITSCLVEHVVLFQVKFVQTFVSIESIILLGLFQFSCYMGDLCVDLSFWACQCTIASEPIWACGHD